MAVDGSIGLIAGLLDGSSVISSGLESSGLGLVGYILIIFKNYVIVVF